MIMNQPMSLLRRFHPYQSRPNRKKAQFLIQGPIHYLHHQMQQNLKKNKPKISLKLSGIDDKKASNAPLPK